MICFRISLSQQLEANAVVCCLPACARGVTTRPRTARHTVKQIQDLKLELLPHPLYSPDFAPTDFHLVWPLKDAQRGRHLRLHEEVKEAVHDWLAQQPKDFSSRGIYVLVECWRCAGRGGD